MYPGALSYEYVQHLERAGRVRRPRHRPVDRRIRRDMLRGSFD
jgi:hypothetical protein